MCLAFKMHSAHVFLHLILQKYETLKMIFLYKNYIILIVYIYRVGLSAEQIARWIAERTDIQVLYIIRTNLLIILIIV